MKLKVLSLRSLELCRLVFIGARFWARRLEGPAKVSEFTEW